MPTFFKFRQRPRRNRAAEDVVGKSVRGSALGMREKMTLYLERYGRIGVSEPMLHWGGCESKASEAAFRAGRARVQFRSRSYSSSRTSNIRRAAFSLPPLTFAVIENLPDYSEEVLHGQARED